MTVEQIKLFREAYLKPAKRPDGRDSTISEYIRICLDGGMDFVTSKDAVLWDDANEIVHCICMNEDGYSQCDFPVKIISAPYDIVFEIEGIMSQNNFETILDSAPFASLATGKKKDFLISYTRRIKNQPIQPSEPEPFFKTEDEPMVIPMGSPTIERTETTYSVSYDANGGDGEVPESVEGLSTGDMIELVEGSLTKEGAVFIGWSKTLYKNPLTKAPAEEAIMTNLTMLNSSVTLYAVYAIDENEDGTPDYEESHKFVYNGNAQGGTVDNLPAEEEYHVGETVKLTKTVPTHTAVGEKDVVFLGWTKTATDRIYTIEDADEYKKLVFASSAYVMGFEDMTLYAVWAYDSNSDGVADVLQNSYTLSYNLNGGELDTPTEKITGLLEGTDIILDSSSTPTKNQCVFIGWSMKKITEPLKEAPKDGTIIKSVIMNADIVVYAVYASDIDGSGVPDYDEYEEPGTGNIHVSMTVSGENFDPTTDRFNVTIKFNDDQMTGHYGSVDVEAGIGIFEIGHGETVEITDVKKDTTYGISLDEEALKGRYTNTSSELSGTVEEFMTNEVAISLVHSTPFDDFGTDGKVDLSFDGDYTYDETGVLDLSITNEATEDEGTIALNGHNLDLTKAEQVKLSHGTLVVNGPGTIKVPDAGFILEKDSGADLRIAEGAEIISENTGVEMYDATYCEVFGGTIRAKDVGINEVFDNATVTMERGGKIIVDKSGIGIKLSGSSSCAVVAEGYVEAGIGILLEDGEVVVSPSKDGTPTIKGLGTEHTPIGDDGATLGYAIEVLCDKMVGGIILSAESGTYLDAEAEESFLVSGEGAYIELYEGCKVKGHLDESCVLSGCTVSYDETSGISTVVAGE